MSDYVSPELTREIINFPLQAIYAQETIPAGLHLNQLEVLAPLTARSLVARITGYVLGQEGEPARFKQTVTVTRFPKWLPKRLQRRWSQSRTVEYDATPVLLYPDLEWPEITGRSVEIVRTSGPWWQDDGE